MELDFDFSPKKKSHTQYYVDKWAQHMEELRKFKRKNGHCRVPQRYTENKKLGGWCLYIRGQYRKMQLGEATTMTRDRVQQLADLGFDFAPRKGRPTSSDSESVEGDMGGTGIGQSEAAVRPPGQLKSGNTDEDDGD